MRPVFLILLCLATPLAFAQNQLLDSLYTELKNHPQEDTVRLQLIFAICYKEYTSHPEKNKAFAEEGLRIAQKIHTPAGRKGMGSANRYIALYYWTQGDYDKAIHYAYENLRIYETIAYIRGQGQAYQLIGLIHEEDLNFEKAKTFYTKALETYQQEYTREPTPNLKRDIGYSYNSLGSLSIRLLKYDEARAYFEKSLAVRQEINDEDGVSQSYANLAYVFVNQKNYEKANVYFEKAEQILLKLNNQFRIAVNYRGMSNLYKLTGDFQKAEAYLLKSLAIAKSMNHQATLKEDYLKLTDLEQQQGHFEKALAYHKLAAACQDSIYTETKAQAIAEVETRYETEKKDQVIQLLERDNQLRALRTNILIAAFILMIVLFVFVYYLQRFRERKNRRILNLEIDRLMAQHKELSEKYKNVVSSTTAERVDSQDQRLLKKAVEVVENNLSNSLFTVDKMALELGMSRTNMHRRIKAITGFPPSELIRTIRLRKAAALLLQRADSVSQISLTVGFEDQSYFSKSFKKEFGVSPSGYGQGPAAP